MLRKLEVEHAGSWSAPTTGRWPARHLHHGQLDFRGLIDAGVYEFAFVFGAQPIKGATRSAGRACGRAAVSPPRRPPLDSLWRCRNTATSASEKWTAS